MLDALQSPSQHTGFPTPRSAGELEDTSTLPQMDSIAFTCNESIDSYYVDGLSVTHGSPRNHIRTFAARLNNESSCPCTYPYAGPPAPPFVGENFFCEAGNIGLWKHQWYLDDPLWDSQGCISGSTCCDRGGPWFTTTLSQTTSDDIEVRICSDEDNSSEDIGLEKFEILVI